MESNGGLSQYEQIKISNMNRRASGVAILGLVVGVAGVVTAVPANVNCGCSTTNEANLSVAFTLEEATEASEGNG